MNKYILVAFAVMGVGFYELSGGAEFQPGDNALVVFAEPNPVAASIVRTNDVVARARTQSNESDDIAPTIRRNTVPAKPVLANVPLTTAVPVAASVEPIKTATATKPVAAFPEVAIPEPVAAPDPQRDLRFVDGDRVNMRGGPGTGFAVVGKLLRDDMVEVLKDEGNGWLHLRVSATGEEGWMADWLVTAAN